MTTPKVVFEPTFFAGATTIAGAGAAGGDASYTIDSNGEGQATLTIGAAGLIRGSVYTTSSLNFGACWSPGGDIGAGGGASIDGSLCIGTDGVSVGGDIGYGFLTSGFSITIVQW
jgi:hypothetical protein